MQNRDHLAQFFLSGNRILDHQYYGLLFVEQSTSIWDSMVDPAMSMVFCHFRWALFIGFGNNLSKLGEAACKRLLSITADNRERAHFSVSTFDPRPLPCFTAFSSFPTSHWLGNGQTILGIWRVGFHSLIVSFYVTNQLEKEFSFAIHEQYIVLIHPLGNICFKECFNFQHITLQSPFGKRVTKATRHLNIIFCPLQTTKLPLYSKHISIIIPHPIPTTHV